jgi:hypothetical protein
MAIDLQVSLVNRNNDEATLTLATGVRTQIQPGFDDIQFVYIRVVSLLDVYVYKNRSPEYWSVDRCFVAMDTEIDQLSLMAPAEATVYIYVGGE